MDDTWILRAAERPSDSPRFLRWNSGGGQKSSPRCSVSKSRQIQRPFRYFYSVKLPEESRCLHIGSLRSPIKPGIIILFHILARVTSHKIFRCPMIGQLVVTGFQPLDNLTRTRIARPSSSGKPSQLEGRAMRVRVTSATRQLFGRLPCLGGNLALAGVIDRLAQHPGRLLRGVEAHGIFRRDEIEPPLGLALELLRFA